MTQSNETIEQYLNEVRREIHNLVPCEEFIDSLRQELEDALDINGKLDLHTLIDTFGEPETVARDYLESKEELEPKKIAKKNKKKNIIILLLVATIAFACWYLWDIHQHTQLMATDVITIEE